MKFKNSIILFMLVNFTVLFGQDGSLDNTFSGDGIAITPIGNSDDIGYSAAVQSDGKIVVAGASQDLTGQYDFAVVRYNIDGSLDNNFGTAGKVTTDIKGEGATDYGYSVAIQKYDDKIVVAGWTFANSDFAVARYNPNGSLDDAFGSGGKITTSIGTTDKGLAVAIQNDGKIVVAGYSYGGDTYDFAVVRYDTNGVLDDTFSSDGRVVTDFASDRDYGMGLAIQPDDKIIVVGVAKDGIENKLGVVRYNNDGSLDTSFNTSGKVLTLVGNSLAGNSALVAVQPDDKIVAACTYTNGEFHKIGVVRYNSDGSLDTDFGTNGIVLTSISDYDDEVYSLKLQDDGKILVGGYATSSVGHDFALVRYNSDGSLDTDFNADGIVTTHLTSEWSFDDAYGMALKNDKIILCGRTDNGDNYNFAVAQYNNDGTVSVESNLLSTQNLEFNLSQNYPNPFNPSTKINYTIANVGNGHARSSTNVTLKVYNVLGQEVATLVNKQQQPGNYEVVFDASSLPSGTYFYRLTAGEFFQTKKLLSLK